MTDRAIVAEFYKDAGGRTTLFSLTVIDDGGRTQYDVEHSRKYGYIFDQSGFGGSDIVRVSGIYFTSGDVRILETPTRLVDAKDNPPWRGAKTGAIRARNRTRRLRALPTQFDLAPEQDLLDWLERNGIQQDQVYCVECRDWMPSESLCKHVWWCDVSCWYSNECTQCVDGYCRDNFGVEYPNPFDDGALWFWAGAPELRNAANV